MTKHYCKVHGEYSDGGLFTHDGCPGCQEEERRAEDARQEMTEKLSALSAQVEADRDAQREAAEELQRVTKEAAEEAARAVEQAAFDARNPGEYECPTCGALGLKYLKTRCQVCRADVLPDYWPQVKERERIEREAAIERERIARAKAEEERVRRAEEQRRIEEARLQWLASPEYAKEQTELAAKALAERDAIEMELLSKRYAKIGGIVGCIFAVAITGLMFTYRSAPGAALLAVLFLPASCGMAWFFGAAIGSVISIGARPTRSR